MLFKFLENHRADLVKRCKDKVAARPRRAATDAQLANGVPTFLEQLIRTLKAESAGQEAAGAGISGASGGDGLALSELGLTAIAHGASLLSLRYTVDQVVHDYGDLCQSITDLAFELEIPISTFTRTARRYSEPWRIWWRTPSNSPMQTPRCHWKRSRATGRC